MGSLYLKARLDLLRHSQNADGGWGYFAGKQSWIEPTAYAAMALCGEPEGARAWSLLKSWQSSDGSWQPSADVQIASWATALCVNLAMARGESGDPVRRGVEWLLGSSGKEASLINRAAARVGLLKPGRDLSLDGWPWEPGTSSWVEPTSHTIVALKKAASKIPSGELRRRVETGEAQLLDIRCRDGGWNYGSPSVFDVDLPSYPETTALALIGLQKRPEIASALDPAAKTVFETTSPLARAWLTIALRVNGRTAPDDSSAPIPDLYITAIQALGASGGNLQFFQAGGTT